jgi:hypothetical protein
VLAARHAVELERIVAVSQALARPSLRENAHEQHLETAVPSMAIPHASKQPGRVLCLDMTHAGGVAPDGNAFA